MKELGIYGGTFAPVHNGHIRAAHAFYDELTLDRLLVIPTFLPPHKDITFEDDPETRLEMLRLAFKNDRRNIEVSDFEIKTGGKSYTYLTLEHFSASDTRLTFLCGTDMFLTFEQWRNPEKIFSLCRVAHMRRENTDAAAEAEILKMKSYYEKRYCAEIVEILSEPVNISSSEIRAEIRAGNDISSFVPREVCDYITEKKLYGKQ